MPQKISMMVSTTSRYQPFSSPTATPPNKILSQGRPKKHIGQTLSGFSIIERIRHTPAGCGSCGGR